MTFFQNFTQRTINFISNALYVLTDYARTQRLFSENHRVLDKPAEQVPPPPKQEEKETSYSSPRSVVVEEEVPVIVIPEVNRSVRFNPAVSVILIPTKKEYRKAELTNTLWWQPADYTAFKKDTSEEVSNCMKKNKITGPEALHLLFQPTDSDRSECKSEPSSALSGTFSH